MRKSLSWMLLGTALAYGAGCSSNPSSLSGPSNPTSPTPTPTQPPVFFVSQSVNNDDNLFSVVWGSSNVVTLTSYSSPDAALEPSYSVAAGRLAYCLVTGASSKVLATCKADGSQPATLSSTATYLPQDPSWSPDGTQIAFSSYVGILKVGVPGSGPSTLSANGSSPSWSPDGTRIVFSNGGHLYTMSAVDGSGVTDLSAGSLGSLTGVSDIYPAWSPDGTKIAFSSNRNAGSTGTQAYNQVFLMAANGSGVTEVTVTSSVAGQSKDGTEVRWSPDGAHLLYSAIVNGSLVPGIFQVNLDGTGEAPFAAGSVSYQIVGDIY